MVKTHRRKKMYRTKKYRTNMRTRKRKGGAPTPAQLARAAKGYRDSKKRPPALKIGKTPSPTDKTIYVYNPETPSHVKILAKQKKRKIINNPLDPELQLHILEIINIPEHMPTHMDPATQYFFIQGDESREIFTFGPDDVKLQPTGYAYIAGNFEKLL
jgi:hypothetical protein